MSLYWVYDLPSWLFAVLTIAISVAIGLAGLYATRKWVRRVHGSQQSHNDVVGYYLAAVCVFYGITLGLLAVATWQYYTDVQTRVGQEAARVGVLYRDVSEFSEPYRSQLQADLRTYTRQVVDVAWPLQRKGIVPESEGRVLNEFERHLTAFEPQTEGQKALFGEAYASFYQLADLRGRRLQSVGEGLAGAIMDRGICRRLPQYRLNLVLRYEKPEHALLDDGNACCSARSPDFYVGRTRQPFSR
jgi:hypothetical protein